jgi:hypothetical protein
MKRINTNLLAKRGNYLLLLPPSEGLCKGSKLSENRGLISSFA